MNPVELLCFRNTLGILDATQLTVIKAFDIEIDNLISISRKMLSKEKFQTNLNEKDQNMLDILKIGTSAGGLKLLLLTMKKPDR
jgi:hypothetical protein